MSRSDDEDSSLRYTAPGLAAAHTLAEANAHGSPGARRRARIMAWGLIAAGVLLFGAPLVWIVFGS